MKVGELIAALAMLDPALDVQAEGCQMCLHPIVGVHQYDGNPLNPERDVVLEVDA